jgi:hypothetical protein
MPTLIVDPEDGGVLAGTDVPGRKPREVLALLEEPIPEDGRPCLLDGRPCILFADWDYGEDWSGEFVREVHPFTLIGAPTISVAEFWSMVKRLRGVE